MTRTSLARLIATQRNAAQSTGPRSPEGKQRSLDHGLCSLALILPGKSAQRLDQHFVASAWADSRAHLHRSLRELTLLCGPGSPAPPNQAFTSEYPQKPNEPNAENAHPIGGDREPRAA